MSKLTHFVQHERGARVYLNVPYVKSSRAKEAGAWFDPVKKQWFAPNRDVALACYKFTPFYVEKRRVPQIAFSTLALQRFDAPCPACDHHQEWGILWVLAPFNPWRLPPKSKSRHWYPLTDVYDLSGIECLKPLQAVPTWAFQAPAWAFHNAPPSHLDQEFGSRCLACEKRIGLPFLLPRAPTFNESELEKLALTDAVVSLDARYGKTLVTD